MSIGEDLLKQVIVGKVVCPICGKKMEIKKENDGNYLICPNRECNIKISMKLIFDVFQGIVAEITLGEMIGKKQMDYILEQVRKILQKE